MVFQARVNKGPEAGMSLNAPEEQRGRQGLSGCRGEWWEMRSRTDQVGPVSHGRKIGF